MADRDKIPASILPQWRSLYKQVCEQQAPSAIAESALRPIRDSTRALGNTPVDLISRMTAWFKPLGGNSLFSETIDWDREHRKVDDFAKEAVGDHYGIELASKACHHILNKIEANIPIPDFALEAYKQYLLNVYVAQFEEHIPPLEQHHADIDQDILEQHLMAVRPEVEHEVEYLAEQLAKHNNVNSLNLPNRTRPTEEILESGDIMQGIVG